MKKSFTHRIDEIIRDWPRSGSFCPACGKPMQYAARPQWAHFIRNTKGAKTRDLIYGGLYGFYVDHHLNKFRVCSLECNNAIQSAEWAENKMREFIDEQE